MNILLILSDTLRADSLGCYGNRRTRTPNIDALAREAVLFGECHCASFPTGPMRKDLHSGRFTFTYHSWAGEFAAGEALLGEVLRARGYVTAMIADTPGHGPVRHTFDHFEFIAGQAGTAAPADAARRYRLPARVRKLRVPSERLQRLLHAAATRRGEEDCFVAQSMRAAHRWLESLAGQARPRSKPFFLLVDTFDPHEPWDAPQHYLQMYSRGYKGDALFEPAYEESGYASGAEIKHMRDLYAAEVTLVDRWIGYLLDGLDRMGLAGNTAVILTSDHGFYHGEHGLIGKVRLDRRGRIVARWPLYRTITHVPLIARVPGLRGGRTSSAFCQPPDLMPTILDLASAKIPPSVQGRSLVPVMSGSARSIRDFAVSSLTYQQDAEVRCPTSFRTRDYLYIDGGDEWPASLYDLGRDPGETRNVIDRKPEIARRMHERYIAFLEEINCPRERIEARRVFPPLPRRRKPPTRVI